MHLILYQLLHINIKLIRANVLPGINNSGNGIPVAKGGAGNCVLLILIRVWKGLCWICTGFCPGLCEDKISRGASINHVAIWGEGGKT